MRTLIAILGLLALAACNSKIPTYVYPTPVDTDSKEVKLLADQVFVTMSGVTATSDFQGGRLGAFKAVGPRVSNGTRNIFVADIPSENQPINQSPWYAFGLNAVSEREVTIRMRFPEGVGNRYLPKTARSLSGPWTYVPLDLNSPKGKKTIDLL